MKIQIKKILMNVIKCRKLFFRIFGGDYGSPAENQFENELGVYNFYVPETHIMYFIRRC